MKGAWLVVLVTLAVLSLVLHAAPAPSERPGAEEPASTLWATAAFANWTVTGDPCGQGSGVLLTAHFLGNASGGVPPYQFSWTFGDGSPPSTVQDPSHVFTRGYEWNVTLNVTDAGRTEVSASVLVLPPIFSCPAELGRSASFGGWILVGLVALIVAGAAVATRVLRRRARQKGGDAP
ncbi:MAG TPA: PKD domain-containing protein [Thermoplasmata archaeon]|nr:PKD domain-containing protein [Thermoplasmata archaeon]